MIRVTPAEHKRVKIEAIERNVTMSMLVKQAIVYYMRTFSDKS